MSLCGLRDPLRLSAALCVLRVKKLSSTRRTQRAAENAKKPGNYFLRPIAKRLSAERTYITPSDNAGVAISNSPIEFVAM